jgi:hypothetical protein
MAEQLVTSRRMLLRDESGERDVQEFADRIGWPRREDVAEDREAWRSRRIVWYSGPAIALHYGDDLLTGLAYAMISGTDPVVVEKMTELVELELDTVRPHELFRAVDAETDPDGLAAALVRLGLAAPKRFDEDFFRRITGAFGSDSAVVRDGAVWATTFEVWPEYVPALKHLLDHESDDEVAKTARFLLEELANG